MNDSPMTDQQIQLGIHLALLADDRYTLLFRKPAHPHAIVGAGFVMSLVSGKEFATNAEVVKALKVAFETIPNVVGDFRSDAPGCTGNDFVPLPESKFVAMTLQTLDLLRGLQYVPSTGNYLIMQDFYNYY
ncbi:hypothetical protein BF128_004562 [Escherichia coli]|nr:hypothetical protein [Escherichia coli]